MPRKGWTESQWPEAPVRALAVAACLCVACLEHASAQSTIDPVNRFAYCANVGWVDWRGDVTNGAVIGEYVCAGWLQGANVGWISLGQGAPTNGIRYGNQAPDDYGVNVEHDGALRGFAYGANIGWIAFESNGVPQVDFRTGALTGHAYGANVGWIGLSNLWAYVQTVERRPAADTDHDGLPDAWEREHGGGLDILTGGDFDRDGVSDSDEYVARTNPRDAGDYPRLSALVASPDGTLTLAWRSDPGRLYVFESATNALAPWDWAPMAGTPYRPEAGTFSACAIPSGPMPARYFRVGAVLPLSGVIKFR